MKRTKNKISLLLALALCVAVLTACGNSKASNFAYSEAMAESPQAVSGYSYGYDAVADVANGGSSAELLPEAGRKIIYNASLSLESKQYAETLNLLLGAVAEANGYIESSEQGGNAEDGNRWVQYTFRIPSDQYSAFLNNAEATGNVVSKRESTEDITAQYVDVEARLASLKTQEERLMTLAEQSGTLEELLAIEEKLMEVRYNIESYTGQQRVYDSLLDYSSVNVYLDEVAILTPAVNNFGNRVGVAFKGSWSGFVNGLQDFIIGLIYALPTLMVLALIGWVVFKLYRKVSKAGEAKREAQRAHRAQYAAQNPQSQAPSAPAYQKLDDQPKE